MSTHKRIDAVCIAAILLSLALTVLLMGGALPGAVPVINAAADSNLFTADDLNTDWDNLSAARITLSDEGSTVNGNGAYVYDGNVCIAYAGRYVVTGELTDGSIIVDADKSDKIWISLDGVTLHCEDDAAIRVEQADHVFLTLSEGSENIISSGEQYNAEAASSGVDGVIYSRDDLTINGTGSLMVDAGYQHGIVCNDDLILAGGTIAITAVQDGVHANDSVRIRDSVLSISAGDDGITVSNDDETSFFYVESGSISIPACYEGIEAVDITIAGGTIEIMPEDDGINANGSGSNAVIRVTDGDIRIINSGGRDADGLDSNGSIYIEGGRVFISVSDNGGNCALDYGSENGGECVVSGGTVIACGGSTMAEGFDADSAQGFLMYTAAAAAGTTVSLTDSEGRELISEEIPCSFSSAVLSAPGLQVGDICTISIDGVQEEITIDNSSASGFGAGGMFGGGMRGGGMRGGDMRGEEALPAFGMIEPPEGAEPFEAPEGAEPFEDRERADDMELPDRQGMRGEGGKQFTSGEEQFRENRAQFPQQDREQTNRQGADTTEAAVSVDTLVLLGISVLVLLIGLLIAVRIRH